MDTMGDVVNVVETMIDNRLAAAGAAVEELPEGTRPRCDPKAEKLENAYDLEDVFVPSDLADLDISDLLAVQPGDIQKTLESRRISSPSFCYSRLEKELNKAAKHRSKDRIRRLVYISLLLQTFATFSGPNKSYHTALLSGRLGGVSHSIAQSLLSRFALQKPGETDKPTFGCNAQLKDKLACYIIVACLSLENYEIDVSMLAKDMRQSQRKWVGAHLPTS